MGLPKREFSFDSSDELEGLKKETREFISAFESSQGGEEEMKEALSLYRDSLLNRAEQVGGTSFSQMKTLIRVCEDYANRLGMWERVKQEIEEMRLHLDL